MLHERDGLIREGEQWRLSADALGIPPKIKDIILQRLSVLLRDHRRILDAASVIGEKFNIELLASVLALDCLEAAETLDTIAKDTSLVYCEGELYRFDHARSREAIYEEISPVLKRGYHAKVAENLEVMCKGGKPPLSEIAFHFAQAGNKEKAVKYSLAAGRDALARWSNAQAIKHFAYTLQNVPEGHAEERRTALEGLGDAYAANSMYAEAIKTFDKLAASEAGAVRLRALRKAIESAYLKGDKPDILLEFTRKAQKLAAYDRLEMARVLNNRGRAFAWAGRGDAKLDLADYEAALQVFEEENSLADAAEALWRCGIVGSTFFKDLHEKGLGELLRSAAILRELGDLRKEIVATIWAGVSLWLGGLFPEARREHTNVLRIGEKLDAFTDLAHVSVLLGSYDEFDGKFAEALSQTLKALEYCKKTDAYWIHGFVYATLAQQYSRLGDLKQADDYFDRISKLPSEMLSHLMVGPHVARAKAIYLAAKAQWEESNDFFEKMLSASSAPGIEIVDRADYAWVLERQGRIEEARVQQDRIQKLLDQVEERFGHANMQLSVMVLRKIQVGEEFEMRLDLVNVGRRPGALIKIADVVSPEFNVASLPSFCNLQNDILTIKNKGVGPFQVETIKLKLKATKAGSYNLSPEVNFMDDLGKMKAFRASPITITVQPVKPAYEALPGRVTSGHVELDRLLLGGIPEKYAVLLVAPSSDERQLLIRAFLEAGAKANETTLYITCETSSIQDLAKQFKNLCLVDCSPQADLTLQNLPNTYKLKGIDNLTNIDIALTKYFRTLNPTQTTPRRALIDLLSDVLLEHHTVVTRKWLSSLLTNLKTRGFTTLAVIDPRMHTTEEKQAILSLFDGEINISEKETAKGLQQVLRIRKLYNQKYLEDELTLAKQFY